MTLARIHLDPIGGIAGDMFVAAMCDAFPEHVPGMLEEVAKLRSPSPLGEGRVSLVAHSDGRRLAKRDLAPE